MILLRPRYQLHSALHSMKSLNELIAVLVTPHAPTQLWRTAPCGLIDMSIDNQGRWFHQGSEITRLEMMKLFASVLNYSQGIYTLITPSEKCQIQVADVPFLIKTWTTYQLGTQSVIVCEDNLGRQWPICEQFPLITKLYCGQVVPYLCLPNGLTARIQRSVYYQWADIAEQDSKGAYLNSANNRYYLC